MDFDERVKFLRKLPKFMVVPEIEVRGVAFPAKEKASAEESDFVLGKTENGVLTVTSQDIEKIIRSYPDLKAVLG